MRRNQICGMFLVLTSVLALVLILQFKPRPIEGDPGPKLFPAIGALGMFITGIIVFFQRSGEEKPLFSKDGWKKIIILFACFIGYVLLLKYVGYIISTLIVLFTITTIFSQGKQVSIFKRAVFTLAITLSIYVLFVKVLHVMLPMGYLF